MRRRRGFAMHLICLTTTLVIASLVTASEAVVRPWHLEVRRRAASEETRVLAESGIAVARAELARTGRFDGIAAAKLGRGTIDVTVERSGSEWVVTSTAKLPAPIVAGRGGALMRRIRARFAPAPGGAIAVVEWKEL